MFACMYSRCAWYLKKKPERGVRLSGTIVVKGCELPRGFWEQNQGPLGEQQVILTEPSLQLLGQILKVKKTVTKGKQRFHVFTLVLVILRTQERNRCFF